MAQGVRCMSAMPTVKKASLRAAATADSKPVRIGCIPLVDCAPLVAAEALGIFAAHGVSVELCWSLGWASIREGIHYRKLDCAHSIAGLVFAMRTGVAAEITPVFTPFVFNLHGNAITMGIHLWNSGARDADSLGKLIRGNRHTPFTFAAVSRYASHYFLLRRWLEKCGLDPDKDVRIVILPPRLMPECLSEGLIDGFCAGEPWNTAAVKAGAGWCPAVSSDLASGHAEKILLVHEAFAAESPDRLGRLLQALLEACAWCDQKANRGKLTTLLNASGNFPCVESLSASLTGPFSDGAGGTRDAGTMHIFHRGDANRATAERGAWVLNELIHHHVLPAGCRRSELLRQCWRAAA